MVASAGSLTIALNPAATDCAPPERAGAVLAQGAVASSQGGADETGRSRKQELAGDPSKSGQGGAANGETMGTETRPEASSSSAPRESDHMDVNDTEARHRKRTASEPGLEAEGGGATQ